MKNTTGRNAAAAMVFIGGTIRLFFGMAVQYPNAYNASWLCPLLGLVLFIPLALSVYHAEGTSSKSPWKILNEGTPPFASIAISLILAALLLYDCAASMRHLAATANYISLSTVSVRWLVFPLVLTIFLVIFMGGDAAGNSARIWMKLVPFLFLIVLIVQFESYNPAWLTPVLGGGIPSVLNGGVLCGGWLALMFLPWITAEPDRNGNHPLRPGILAALGAAFLLMLLQMLCPVLADTQLSQIARTEIILSNNRVSHILQIFLTLLCLGSMLHLIAIEAVSAALLVQHCFPGMQRWLLAGGCAILAGILSISELMRSSIAMQVYGLFYIIIGGSIALWLSLSIIQSGGKRNA